MSGPEMTGPGHYREAERLIESADEWMDADFGWKGHISVDERLARRQADLAAAQVHATLALAAATAYPAVRDHWGDAAHGVADDTCREWAGVAS